MKQERCRMISILLFLFLVIVVFLLKNISDKLAEVEFERDMALSRIHNGEDRLDVILKDKMKRRIIVCSR